MNRKILAMTILVPIILLPAISYADPGGQKAEIQVLKAKVEALTKPVMKFGFALVRGACTTTGCDPNSMFVLWSYANVGNRTAYYTNMTTWLVRSDGSTLPSSNVTISLGNVPGRTTGTLWGGVFPNTAVTGEASFVFKDLAI